MSATSSNGRWAGAPVTRLPLDGDAWRCKAYLGEEWLMRRAYAPDTGDVHGWHAATVPGSVVADLVRAGEVPDPRVDRNSRSCEWVADRSWVYRRDVWLDLPPDARVVLHCEGIDHAADLYWNGEPLGRHEGMFIPAERDVTAHAVPGRNVVAVVLAPAPAGEPQVGRTDRVRSSKSRMTYGWDFCPRLVHLGLWDRTWLDVVAGVRLAAVQVAPRIELGAPEASVDWSATVEVAGDTTLEIEADAFLQGERVAVQRCHLSADTDAVSASGTLEIAGPALWWPNGSGSQPLYTLRVRVTAGDGSCAEQTVRFGLREIRMVPNEGAPPDARPYTLVVNGRRTYIQGWNWVPLDLSYGVEDPDRLAHLLDLAARAHVNLLRVWGGGLIEKEAFYDRCDELGILVWQELPLSSSGIASTPARDAAFVARMATEADVIVRRRRNHPSLALWCGGNELAAPDGTPLGDAEPVLAALRDVVALADPGRAWLPTSPSGPQATCTLAAIAADPDGQHDVHGPWEHQGLEAQRTLYDRATSLLHSEFGVEGMAPLATIEAFVSPAHRWPADRSNPHWVHRGDWWINTPLVQASFGGGIEDLAALVRASQLLQAEGLRYAVEANRRRQWRNSGSIPWQLNEPFPNGFCTSAIDACGRPKPAYFAVAAAYRPLLANASFPTIAWGGRDHFVADLWVSSAREELPAAGLSAALVDVHGRRHHASAWDVDVRPGSSARVSSVRWSLEALSDVFWLELRLLDAAGAERATSRYVHSRAGDLRPLRHLPPARLQAELAGGAVEVANRGTSAALLVDVSDGRPATARGFVAVDGSGFSLLPGEERRIGVSWRAVSEGERRLVVRGWNTAEIRLA